MERPELVSARLKGERLSAHTGSLAILHNIPWGCTTAARFMLPTYVAQNTELTTRKSICGPSESFMLLLRARTSTWHARESWHMGFYNRIDEVIHSSDEVCVRT